MRPDDRYIPLLKPAPRTVTGIALLILSSISAVTILDKGRLWPLVLASALAWLPAVLLTDKYVHKYPQRYFTYLLASHLKASVIMAFFLWIESLVIDPLSVPKNVLWVGFSFFVFADAAVSSLRRRGAPVDRFLLADLSSSKTNECISPDLASIDKSAIIREANRLGLEKPLVEFIEGHLPDQKGSLGSALALEDIPSNVNGRPEPVGLLVGRLRMNDVRRLNRFLQFCADRLPMGGYLAIRYMPLENTIANLKRRYPPPLYWPAFTLHFLWYRALPKVPWLDTLYFSPIFSWMDALFFSFKKKRNRALSKAEAWGRLSYCGMHVLAESGGDGERHIVAQRIALPVQNKKPSYYPIVALEKVALDGAIIRTHKLRTMFPFSEFLQKRVFEDNGLASTGKFANDFRLTEYGKFIRKYWLDELPQIYDWLRGEIKLVGIRATSRHFLSLYPQSFLDLYVQIKPGLIPPIFDELTNGFQQIVEVELAYLKRYFESPLQTDVRYLLQTFTDIVFRGIRSK